MKLSVREMCHSSMALDKLIELENQVVFFVVRVVFLTYRHSSFHYLLSLVVLVMNVV